MPPSKPKYSPRPPPRDAPALDVTPSIKAAFVAGQPPAAPAEPSPATTRRAALADPPPSAPAPSAPPASSRDRVVTLTEPSPPERKTMRLASGEEVRRVNFLYSPELIRRLKTYCATRDTDMTSATRDILDAYLKSLGF